MLTSMYTSVDNAEYSYLCTCTRHMSTEPITKDGRRTRRDNYKLWTNFSEGCAIGGTDLPRSQTAHQHIRNENPNHNAQHF